MENVNLISDIPMQPRHPLTGETHTPIPLPSELKPELVGVYAGTAILTGCMAPQRGSMVAAQLSQALPVENPKLPLVHSGTLANITEHADATKMPEDGEVVAVIPKYNHIRGSGNPKATVIYKSHATGRYDAFHIQSYNPGTWYIGYRFKPTELMNELQPGRSFRKGDSFNVTPGISDRGEYTLGTSVNVVFATLPGASNDAVVISEETANKCMPTCIKKVVISIGPNIVPLNLYGDSKRYRVMPDIGEQIRPDTILFGTRAGVSGMHSSLWSPEALMKPMDTGHDTIYYSHASSHDRMKATVIDIDVVRNHGVKSNLSRLHSAQLDEYVKSTRERHESLLSVYEKIKRDAGRHALDIGPELHRLVVAAKAYLDQSLNLLHKKAPMDPYTVTIVTISKVYGGVGVKYTNLSAGKGVVSVVYPDADMPTDDQGNKADIVISPMSVINRTIPSLPYEAYLGAAVRDVTKRLRGYCGFDPNKTAPRGAVIEKYKSDPELITKACDILGDFIGLIAYKQSKAYDGLPLGERVNVLDYYMNDTIRIILPSDNELLAVDTVKALKDWKGLIPFRPNKSRITFRDDRGVVVTTENEILVGTIQLIQLDKIATDGFSTTFPQVNGHGIASTSGNAGKHHNPSSVRAARALGEAEVIQVMPHHNGAEGVARIYDLTVNPETHGIASLQLLLADRPSDIQNIYGDDPATRQYKQTPIMAMISSLFLAGGRILVGVDE